MKQPSYAESAHRSEDHLECPTLVYVKTHILIFTGVQFRALGRRMTFEHAALRVNFIPYHTELYHPKEARGRRGVREGPPQVTV